MDNIFAKFLEESADLILASTKVGDAKKEAIESLVKEKVHLKE
jgi:hypothetical protein